MAASRSRIARPAAKLPLSGTGCPATIARKPSGKSGCRGWRNHNAFGAEIRGERFGKPAGHRHGSLADGDGANAFERGKVERRAIHENVRACAAKLAAHRRGNIDRRKRLAKNLAARIV